MGQLVWAGHDWSATPCTKWNFKVRESTGLTSAIKHYPMAFSTISVGNKSHGLGESGL